MTRRVVGVLAGVAIVAAVVAAASHFVGSDRAVLVRKVLVDVDPAPAAAGIDRGAVRVVVDHVLQDAPGVRVDERGDVGRALRVRVEGYSRGVDGVAVPAGHPPIAATTAAPSAVTLAVEVVEGGRVILRGSSTATAGGVASPDALIDVALRESLQQLVDAQSTDGLDSDALLATLGDSATADQVRRRAMMALAARRDRRATPHLTAALRDEEPAVRATALQGLALLADPDAVEAIIAFSERQPPPVRRQCIDAVRATDSPLAAAWLFVLSTGHPDADVQAHARAALAALPTSPEAAAAAN
jgi:hypothetical protein